MRFSVHSRDSYLQERLASWQSLWQGWFLAKQVANLKIRLIMSLLLTILVQDAGAQQAAWNINPCQGGTQYVLVLHYNGLRYYYGADASRGGVTWTENASRTSATLTGYVSQSTVANDVFYISFNFSGGTGSGTPYLGGGSFCPSPNTANWHYYTSVSGTASGVGANQGAYITFSRTGPAFQIGDGASIQSSAYSGGGWLQTTWVNGGLRNLQPCPTCATDDILFETNPPVTGPSCSVSNVQLQVSSQITCNSSTGSLTLTSQTSGTGTFYGQLYTTSGTPVGSAVALSNGSYTFAGLSAGSYYAVVFNGSNTNCQGSSGAATLSNPTNCCTVSNVQLQVSSQITCNSSTGSLTLTSQTSGTGTFYGQLYTTSGTPVGSAVALSNGSYTFAGLSAGSYYAVVFNGSNTNCQGSSGAATLSNPTNCCTVSNVQLQVSSQITCNSSTGSLTLTSQTSGSGTFYGQLYTTSGTPVGSAVALSNGSYTFAGLSAQLLCGGLQRFEHKLSGKLWGGHLEQSDQLLYGVQCPASSEQSDHVQ